MGTWWTPGTVTAQGDGPATLMEWRFDAHGEVSDQDPEFEACLTQLLELPRRDPGVARGFALRWGVLGVCWAPEHPDGYHKRPATLMELRYPRMWSGLRASLPRPPGPPDDDRVAGIAPLVWWLDVARRLESAIRLRADLDHQHRGAPGDWARLWDVASGHPFDEDRSIAQLRHELDGLIETWHESLHEEYGPPVLIDGRRVQPVDPTGLDVAVLELASQAMFRGERPLVCGDPDCDRTFLKKTRRSRPGELRFCERHTVAERLRLSQRARRASMTDTERAAQRVNDAKRMRDRRANRKETT